MFNSYYAKINSEQNVTINTPSSINGTLVKSHVDSKMICMKIGSDEFNAMFAVENQTVSYSKRRSVGFDSTDPRDWRTVTDTFEYNVEVLQTMLANDNMIFVEYVIKE